MYGHYKEGLMETKYEYVLQNSVELFLKDDEWDGMYRTGIMLAPGEVVTLGGRVQLEYEEGARWVVPVKVRGQCGDGFYLMVEKIGISELIVH